VKILKTKFSIFPPKLFTETRVKREIQMENEDFKEKVEGKKSLGA
jgi:hypothetical protein